MKVYLLSLLVLISCSTSQKRELASVKAELNHKNELVYLVDGIEEKEPPIHPDLLPSDEIDLNEKLEEINSKISDLSSTYDLQSNLEVGVPDYKIVYYRLQKRMTDSLVNFIQRIDQLNLDLKKKLSRLASVQKTYKEYPTEMWKQAYFDEVAKLYPAMQSNINNTFSDAITNLFTLDGYLDLFIKLGTTESGSRHSSHYYIKQGKDYFKGGARYKTTIFSKWKKKRWKGKHDITYGEGCITKMCYRLITEQIANWMSFVDKINLERNIASMQKHKAPKDRSYKLPLNSIAIKNMVSQLVEIGLDKNKVYTKGSAIAEYVKDIGESSLGISLAIVSSPVHILNRVGLFLNRLVKTDQFILTELKINKRKTFKINKSLEDFKTARMLFLNKFERVAVGEDENKGVFARAYTVIKEEPGLKTYFYTNVLPKDKTLYLEFKKYTSSFFKRNKLDHPQYVQAITKYPLDLLEKFSLDDIKTYGESNLRAHSLSILKRYDPVDINKYGFSNIQKHGLEALKKFSLEDIEKYSAKILLLAGLDFVKEHGLENVKKYGYENIKKYGVKTLNKGYSISSLEKFTVAQLDKHGEKNLKRYGVENIEKYGLKNLQDYSLEDLQKYSISEIRRYKKEDVQEYGLINIKKYGLSNLKKYGLHTIERYELTNIQKYGLENIENYSLDIMKKYGSSKIKAAEKKYGKESLKQYGYDRLVNGTSFKCKYTSYKRCRDGWNTERYFWVLRPFKNLKSKCIEESVKHAKKNEISFIEFCGITDIE